MTKILVADLFGTLIPKGATEMEQLYSKGVVPILRDCWEIVGDYNYTDYLLDESARHLSIELRSFFEEGNILYIVSAPGKHSGFSFVINQVISRIYKNIEEYKDQVSFFLRAADSSNLDISLADLKKEGKNKIYEKDGITYIESKEGVACLCIKEKAEAFDFIQEKRDLSSSELFCIGDEPSDMQMLLRCLDLKGKSSLINNHLYAGTWGLDTAGEIIHHTALKEKEVQLIEIIKELYPNANGNEYFEIMASLLKNGSSEYYERERERLYALLNKGELDLYDLRRQHVLWELIKDANDEERFLNPNWKISDQITPDGLSLYPTFREYSVKVLNAKK